jgi:hypothetical protein
MSFLRSAIIGLVLLEHIPSELTRGDSQRSVDERVCRP